MTVFIRKIISTLTATSFVTRLAVGTLCIIMFVVTMTGLFLYHSKHQYEERAIVSTQNLAQVLEQNIDDIIGKTDLVLLAVTDEVKRQTGSGGINERTLNAFIARQKERLAIIDSLRMTDEQGTVMYGTGVESSPKTNIADQNHFILQRDNPNVALFMSKPVLAKISKKWVIPLSRRLNRPDGSFAGTVYANIELNTFITLFSSLNLGTNGTIALRDMDLGVIVRYPESQGVGSTIGIKAASPQLLEMLQAGRNAGTWNSYSAIDNIERVFSFRRLSLYPLYVVVGRAASEYLSDWRNEALNMILLSALFIAAILVSSWQMLLRQKREKQAWEELRKLNTGLEDRIVARTAEVSRFNEQLQDELTERKRTEQALAESEASYRNLFDSSTDGIFIIDLDGNFIDANRTAYKRLGYTREEFLALHISKLDHPSFAAGVPERFKQIREHGIAVFESGHLRKDGSIMPVEVNSRLLEYKGKQVFFSVIRDITERKKAEEALRESEQRYRALFDQSPDGILLIDTKGRMIEFNEMAHRQLGYSREEFARLSLSEIDPNENPEEIQTQIRKIMQEGKADFYVKHRTKQGELRDVHVIIQSMMLSGSSVLHGIWHDITEIKNIRDRLEEKTAEQNAILENALVGIAFLKDRKLIWINSKM